VNNTRITKKWNMKKKPKCIGNKWCKDGKHFEKKMEEMKSKIGRVGKMNGNTILKPDTENPRQNLKNTIGKFIESLKTIQMEDEETNKEWKKKNRRQKNRNYTNGDIIQGVKELNTKEGKKLYKDMMKCLETNRRKKQHKKRKKDKEQKRKKEKNRTKTKTKEKKNQVTERTIEKVKQKLKGMIISLRDKNTTKMYCECPVAHYERLKRSTIEHKNYTIIEGKTEKEILKEMRTEYEKRELRHIGPWNNKGTLPTTYVNPKEKDPINKERTISSYYKVPMRIVYKRTQKVLTWLLRTLPEEYRHFTLHKIGDIKERTAHIKEELQDTFGANTEIIPFSSDVTAMYTHLCQTEIRRAIVMIHGKHEHIRSERCLHMNDKRHTKGLA
jgi:hypothetical protein